MSSSAQAHGDGQIASYTYEDTQIETQGWARIHDRQNDAITKYCMSPTTIRVGTQYADYFERFDLVEGGSLRVQAAANVNLLLFTS